MPTSTRADVGIRPYRKYTKTKEQVREHLLVVF